MGISGNGGGGHLMITESVETRETLHFMNIKIEFSIYILNNEKLTSKLK
jgi:hypothetical protein